MKCILGRNKLILHHLMKTIYSKIHIYSPIDFQHFKDIDVCTFMIEDFMFIYRIKILNSSKRFMSIKRNTHAFYKEGGETKIYQRKVKNVFKSVPEV